MRPAPLLAALALLALGLVVFLVWGSTERPTATATAQAGPAVEVERQDAQLADAGPIAAAAGGATDVRAPAAPQADAPTAAGGPTLLRVRVSAREDARPLGHVSVSAWKDDGALLASGQAIQTDDEGWAELEVEPEIPLRVSAQGEPGQAGDATEDIAPLARGEVRELRISVPTRDDRVAEVRVLDRELLQPILGARVGPIEGRDLALDERAARTDNAGIARVPFATWASPIRAPLLGVQAEGYEPAGFRVDPRPDAPVFEVLLSRTATLRVHLIDAAGAPVAGGSVEATTESYRFARPEGTYLDLGPDPVWRAQTDVTGLAELRDLPPRAPLRVGAHDGKLVLWQPREPLVLAPGEVREATWRVGRGALLTGVVREASGAAAPGVELWLVPAWHAGDRYLESHQTDGLRNVRSDVDGRFAVEGVDAGEWWLGPAPSGPRFGRELEVGPDEIASIGQHVAVPAGAAEVEVEVRLHRGLSIRGRVVGPDGEPVTSAFVQARPVAGGATAYSSVSDASGSFVIGPLAPGEQELVASTVGSFVESEPVRAGPGARDVLLQLQTGAAIRGQVVDAATRAPCAAALVVRPSRPRSWSLMLPQADEGGAFEVVGVRVQPADLAASTSDGRAGVLRGVAVRAGEAREGVVLEVRPGARLRFAFHGPQQVVQVQVLSDGVPVAADGVEKGTERTFVVPAGAVVVQLSVGVTPLAGTRLDVTAGETRAVTYEDGWR